MSRTATTILAALLAALKAQFGKPSQPNQYLDEYYWQGRKTTISADCNSITKACSVFLISSKLFAEKRRVEKQAAIEAASDF